VEKIEDVDIEQGIDRSAHLLEGSRPHSDHQETVVAAWSTKRSLSVRFGELAALRTNDLDMLRRTLRVDEQLSRQGSWKMVAGPLKSKKAYRTIGIPAFLCEELAIHLTEYPSGSDLVFSHAQGGPLDYNRFRRRHWNPAVEASVGPPCTPHDLRHTHVAMLIAENQSPRYIADRLGHESTRTVLDVYGHLYEGVDQAAMEGLDRLRSEAQTDTRRVEHRFDESREGESSIPVRDFCGGRYWDRTSDLCRVNAKPIPKVINGHRRTSSNSWILTTGCHRSSPVIAGCHVVAVWLRAPRRERRRAASTRRARVSSRSIRISGRNRDG